MNCAVRYYSRSGNTKLVADAIAKAAGVKAVSTDSSEAQICEPVDVLFIGGALYAYGIDENLVRSSSKKPAHLQESSYNEQGGRSIRKAEP